LILLYEVSFSTNQLRYREMQVLGGHEGAVNDLAFSPNGALLASGGMDGTARLWNINAQERTFGNVLATLDSDTEDVVLSLAFSPDGSLLATAGGNGDNAIRLWNVTTPAAASLVATLTGHQAAVGSVGFSANGEFLLSASDDGSIRLWSAGR
jgi:WD40 repeat protein